MFSSTRVITTKSRTLWLSTYKYCFRIKVGSRLDSNLESLPTISNIGSNRLKVCYGLIWDPYSRTEFWILLVQAFKPLPSRVVQYEVFHTYCHIVSLTQAVNQALLNTVFTNNISCQFACVLDVQSSPLHSGIWS